MLITSSYKKLKIAIVASISIFLLTGCKKLIEIDPPITSINEENVYKSDVTAIAAVTSIYATMSNISNAAGFTGGAGLSLSAGLSADELTLYSGVTDNRLNAYYKNSLISQSFQNYGPEYWINYYYYIFRCNAAIEGLTTSNSLTPVVKQQLLGEVKFMRAFFYFYLTNLYGDVPLVLTTDPAANAVISRTPQSEVYQHIIADLIDAQGLLSTNFLNGGLIPYSERIRPTKWAATALLARVYLYTGDNTNAEQQAGDLISQTSLFSLTPLNNSFLKNSTEAIWQLQPVSPGRNTEDAFTFIIPSTGPSTGDVNPVYLSTQLLNTFEAGDMRKTNWVDSVTPALSGNITYYFPYKYKALTASGPATEYLMIIRLAEQYLIRAEARVQQNNISGAQTDLNVIRTRAGLPNTTANDKSSILTAILKERQVELFTELGQRWFDLKRTNNINTVMNIVAPFKGGVWQTTDQLYPIPASDIAKNPALLQNPAY